MGVCLSSQVGLQPSALGVVHTETTVDSDMDGECGGIHQCRSATNFPGLCVLGIVGEQEKQVTTGRLKASSCNETAADTAALQLCHESDV